MKSKWSLSRLLILSGMLLSVLFLFVSGLLFYWSGNLQIEEQVREIDSRYVKQLEGKSELMIGEMERFTRYVGESGTLQQLLGTYLASRGDLYVQAQTRPLLNTHFSRLATFYTMIEQFLVYLPDKDGAYKPFDNAWPELSLERLREILTASENKVLIRSEQNLTTKPQSYNVVFYTTILLPDKRSGIIGIRMKADWIAAWFESGKQSVVQDGNGQVLWATQPETAKLPIPETKEGPSLRTQITMAGQSYEMLSLSLPKLHWRIGVLFEPNQLVRPTTSFIQVTVISFLGSVVLAFLFSTLISRRVARPLVSLAKSQQQGVPAPPVKQRMRFGFRDVVLFYYIVILMLPLIASTIVHIYSVSRIIYQTNQSMLDVSMKQNRDNINYFLDMNQRLTLNLATHSTMQDLLASGAEPEDDGQEALLRKMLNETASILTQSAEIYIYDTSGRQLISSSDAEMKLDAKDLAALQDLETDKRQWAGLRVNRYGRNSVIFYFRMHVLTSMLPAGYLALVYEERNIETLFRELHYTGGAVDLVDGDDVIFSSTVTNRVGESYVRQPEAKPALNEFMLPLSKEGNLELKEPLAVSGWSIIANFPISLLLADNIRMMNLVLIILFVSTIVILITSYMISFFFSRSIETLIRNSKNWKRDDSRFMLARGVQFSEVEQLSLSFNRLIAQIERLNRNVYESKLRESEMDLERKDAEIRSLQMQINPHFLYNTLESVKWMVMDDERKLAARMIEKLGDFFRKGISRRKTVVSLAEEKEYTQLYIEIQNMRLGDCIDVTWSISDRLLSYPIIKLLLQPLIENTIHHGYQSGDGNRIHIEVRASESDGMLILEVEDDGVGIPSERLEEIQLGLQSGEMGSHVGLMNVQHRIMLHYGPQYVLEVESPGEHGTLIRLRIPC
ncbi:cache domain-containing sensor histidine kinase [Paenibacillus koleovorans]|uniref:cache domain-containing sensor histidine kinase n=1 Tax=Paenibacillus koleovorans TaxID=121608 RepID=UPI000FD6F0E5|nr:sensor histidine kinase [Paenibacillus koleovorans]